MAKSQECLHVEKCTLSPMRFAAHTISHDFGWAASRMPGHSSKNFESICVPSRTEAQFDGIAFVKWTNINLWYSWENWVNNFSLVAMFFKGHKPVPSTVQLNDMIFWGRRASNIEARWIKGTPSTLNAAQITAGKFIFLDKKRAKIWNVHPIRPDFEEFVTVKVEDYEKISIIHWTWARSLK